MKKNLPALIVVLTATVLILLAQIFHYPSDIRDIVTGLCSTEASLAYPRSYVFFAPFFHWMDHWTLLSIKQHIIALIYLNAAWIFWRFFHRTGDFTIRNGVMEILKLSTFNIVIGIILTGIILVPRPMAKLVLKNDDLIIVDFHSHTNHSWDGRKSFSVEKNLAWHQKAGFNAAFITDHNAFDGAEAARNLTVNRSWPAILGLRGEEVSLYRSHWVLLGMGRRISNEPYDVGYEGIKNFVQEMNQFPGTMVIASLPEYWLYHWNDLNDFANWGVRGIEIVNSAPVAMDFTVELREKVVEFCKEKNLVMTGITDNHGWGSTAYVWNLVRLPGWRAIPRADLESVILSTIKKERFNSVQVVTRIKAETHDSPLRLIFDPPLQIWEGARSLPLSHAVVTLIWFWASFGLYCKRKQSDSFSNN